MVKITIESINQTIDLGDSIDFDKKDFDSIDAFIEYLQSSPDPSDESRDEVLKKFMNSVEIVDEQELD